jgi:hypothetical protein
MTQPSAWYVALHTASPGNEGASNEVSGGGYARQNCTAWTTPASGANSNNAEIQFTLMPAVTVTHFSVWSAASGGTCMWTGALVQSKVVADGETVRIAAGDLDNTLD